MENLLSKIWPGRSAGGLEESNKGAPEQRSPVKVYSLIGATAVLAFASGLLLSRGILGYGALTMVVFMTVLTVQSLTLRYTREMLIASASAALGLTLPFLFAPLVHFAVATAVIFLLFFAAHARGRREESNVLKIKFSHVARPVVGLILTAVVISAVFMLFAGGTAALTEETANKMLDVAVAPLVKGYVKDFSSGAGMGDVLEDVARGQIEKAPGSEELTSFQKQLLVKQSSEEIRNILEERTGFRVQMDASAGKNLHAFLLEKSSGILDPRAPLGIILLTLFVLLLVKSVEFVLYIPLGILAFMLYELLIAFGFVAVQLEARNKEVINLL